MKLVPAAFSLAAALCLAACFAAPLAAQTTFTDPANLRGERVTPRNGRELPIDQGARGLEQLLRKLNTRASLMNIVAHPDDEDGGMLTFYSRGLGARVADLSLNRGEGGQNAMTADFEDALGLLRTQELLASDRYTGVDQFFGTEVDFGFSKTKSEAFTKWGHDRVLYDAVRAIRLYRPLVLTSTWIGGVTDGHGQHQVSGQIAQEAFVAAGDPKVFPELTAEGILPWQPLKIYARVPMQAITPQGLFDYATGQYVPAEFHNYVTGETTTTPPSTDVIVYEGTPDPLLTYGGARALDLSGKVNPDTQLSYVQFARIALGLQKSQIDPGARTAPRGNFDVSYHLYGDRTCSLSTPPQPCHPERSPQSVVEGPASKLAAAQPLTPSNLESQPNFFDGIDTTLRGIATLAPDAPTSVRDELNTGLTALSQQIAQITKAFDAEHPEKSAPALADALQALNDLLKHTNLSSLPRVQRESVLRELLLKRVQLNDALVLALGLTLDATTLDVNPIAGTSVPVWFELRTTFPETLTVTSQRLQNKTGGARTLETPDPIRTVLTADHAIEHSYQSESGISADITRPYFTRSSVDAPVYDLLDDTLRNAPASPPALRAWVTVQYHGVEVQLGRVVHRGDQPVSFVPPVSVSLSSPAKIMLTRDAPGTEVDAFVHTQTEISRRPAPQLALPGGWKLLSTSALPDGKTSFTIAAPAGKDRASGVVTASVKLPSGVAYSEGYRPVGYPGLVSTNLYQPAKQLLVPIDLKLPKASLKVGYLPGTGDDIPDALQSMNLAPPAILSVADLTAANLAQYDTVILGVRTYNAHPDLHGAPTQALLDYARSGGNVLVQFQTPEFTAEDAPYPLSLGKNEKVVDEAAPVTLLATGNAQLGTDRLKPAPTTILTTPNLITPDDFNNWIEERGHGFLSTWDSHYTPLLEVHDPGVPAEQVAPQNPQRGGLITVQLGKGRWTYCAFALYRQLPEAVPGAFRLFANLINP